MSKISKCQGCGAILQTSDQQKVGYALSIDHAYCQACYRLMHYGEGSTHYHPEDLPKLEPDSIVFMVSSVLHLDLLFSYPVYRYQPDAKYVYLINQIDLLPKSTNLDVLIDNMTKQAKKHHIPFVDIILMSAHNKHDVSHLKEYVQSFHAKHIYLVGVQNSGKTTIFKHLTGKQEALAFKKAGLTQETLIGTFENQVIYDMPGLYQQGYLHHFLSYEIYKNLIPDQEIKPKIYQLKERQALFIEGLIACYCLSESSVVLYIDSQIHVHKTKDIRIQSLLAEKEKHFKVYAETYEEKSFKVPQGKYQITLADMGFIHLSGPNTIKLIVPKGLHISLTEALFI